MRTLSAAIIWSLIVCLALSGCGSSEGEPVGSAGGGAVSIPARAEVRSQGAELRLDFRGSAGGSVLSPSVNSLVVSGFGESGQRLFGPHTLARPENDVLVLNLHPSVTQVEVASASGALTAQSTGTTPAVFRAQGRLKPGVAHTVVVNNGGLTPVVVPPTIPTFSVLPFTPTIPATFVCQGSGSLNGGLSGTDMLAVDLNGVEAVQLIGLEDDGSFVLGGDTYEPDPDLSGTEFTTAGNLSSISASFSSQRVVLELYTSTDGQRYIPYAGGFPIPIDPAMADSSGHTVVTFPFDFPLRPNLRYVWLCRPESGAVEQGTLSIATTVDLPLITNTAP